MFDISVHYTLTGHRKALRIETRPNLKSLNILFTMGLAENFLNGKIIQISHGEAISIFSAACPEAPGVATSVNKPEIRLRGTHCIN